ncbi:hypothetical protein TNCV_1019521 [Trichonephila clavipes]|nr:hypothetical protein TNCV_1019521 [Trichonephila clavipes]
MLLGMTSPSAKRRCLRPKVGEGPCNFRACNFVGGEGNPSKLPPSCQLENLAPHIGRKLKILNYMGLLGIVPVILNHGQLMKTTPELVPPSPNYQITPTRGRLSFDKFNALETLCTVCLQRYHALSHNTPATNPFP